MVYILLMSKMSISVLFFYFTLDRLQVLVSVLHRVRNVFASDKISCYCLKVRFGCFFNE